MIARIAIFIIGLVLLPLGWNETKIAYKYQEPVKMTCQQFLDAAEKPAWVSVDDCVVYLGRYQTLTKEKTGVVTSMAVMVFPSVETASDDKTMTSVVLNIVDEAKRNTIKDNLTKLNALLADKDPSKNPERQERYDKLFEKGNLVLKEEALNENFDLLKAKLSAQHTTYKYSSLADKSSITKGILTILIGFAMCAAVVASLVLRKKK